VNLRIISGKFGGRAIKASDGGMTHPMSERVRGSLFNIINKQIESAEVLDIFAGSGSIGLEAISRGASFATFVEIDRLANKILTENITKLDADSVSTSVQMGASSWISKNQDKLFDYIFVDPPYNDMQFSVVSRLGRLLKPTGQIILSHPDKAEVPVFDGVVMIDRRNYGTAALSFYRKK
jgi:16S rRNA (guanine(966)-N(2))-methyltransferase RsmD